ncbi:MAG: BON domain-containing protein [Planctomycetaceae bacterium]|nr:MAG: BON domain-containing protein [Planctomycetaceae bacterium]
MFLLAAAAAAGCDNTSQTGTDGVPVTPSSTSSVDRNATDRGGSDGIATGLGATDRSVTDHSATDRSVTDRGATDRNDTGKTPFDQYENKADVDITAQIRSRVVDTDMSVSAQNAKIITQDGKVTLRGEVKSDTEKQHVETIALAVAGEGNVDNQLQIDQD